MGAADVTSHACSLSSPGYGNHRHARLANSFPPRSVRNVGCTTTCHQPCIAAVTVAGASAQPTMMPAPSPPILAPRPPAPLLSSPPPQPSNAMGTPLFITFYGLDLWSLLTSWGSRIQALLEAQQSPSLGLQSLSAPGMCASQLLALNTTALLNTSLTAQQLMPGLGYFANDVAQLLRDYLQDSSITVQVTDFCAGNRTAASFTANRTIVNGPWPTLRVTINLLTTDPD
ncbi:hypothetical protein QJQ45_017611, partial [Haematococcus lacustris]